MLKNKALTIVVSLATKYLTPLGDVANEPSFAISMAKSQRLRLYANNLILLTLVCQRQGIHTDRLKKIHEQNVNFIISMRYIHIFDARIVQHFAAPPRISYAWDRRGVLLEESREPILYANYLKILSNSQLCYFPFRL